jgi:hypothetical protein
VAARTRLTAFRVPTVASALWFGPPRDIKRRLRYYDLLKVVMDKKGVAYQCQGHRSLKGFKNLSWLKSSQLSKLANAMSVSRIERREIIFDEGSATDTAYILLSGVARITCRNRKDRRVQVVVAPPGMIPAFPLPMPGIRCDFAVRQPQPVRSEQSIWKGYLKFRWGRSHRHTLSGWPPTIWGGGT